MSKYETDVTSRLKSPREKALESRTKPAVLHLTDGTTRYCEFAEWRESGVYARPVEYMDNEEKVADYYPHHKVDSMTRLDGGN